jgi:hypothetical protein
MIALAPAGSARKWKAMSKAESNASWVVYQMTISGQPSGRNAVCEQAEWDAMEADRPGYHTLVRAGIPTEGEAERLARGTSGDVKPRVAVAARPGTPPA